MHDTCAAALAVRLRATRRSARAGSVSRVATVWMLLAAGLGSGFASEADCVLVKSSEFCTVCVSVTTPETCFVGFSIATPPDSNRTYEVTNASTLAIALSDVRLGLGEPDEGESDFSRWDLVTINFAAGTYTIDSAPFAFNSSTYASEVKLVSSAGAILQAAPASTLFKVSAGAPSVTLSGLQLRSQVVASWASAPSWAAPYR